jgi:hypothetical protein
MIRLRVRRGARLRRDKSAFALRRRDEGRRREAQGMRLEGAGLRAATGKLRWFLDLACPWSEDG